MNDNIIERTVKAINLEAPDIIPRTEYSAQSHWPLVETVTGMKTDTDEEKEAAGIEFCKRWEYGFIWATPAGRAYLERNGGRVTSMGHAVYAHGGVDYNDKVEVAFKDVEEALGLDPCKEYGAFDLDKLAEEFSTIYDNRCKMYPFTLNMGGVYITMISGLIAIYGWDMLLYAIGYDPARFRKVMDGYYHWVRQLYEAYAKTDIPYFMCHDDMVWTSGPFNSPEWYRNEVFPRIKKLIEPLKAAGKRIFFTSDGTYDMFYDDIVDCGAEIFCMEPTNDMELFAKKFGKTHAFVGNADCRILQFGSKDAIRQEVERCINIGRDCPGFFMNVGNHIPSNIPVENVLYYDECYREMRNR